MSRTVSLLKRACFSLPILACLTLGPGCGAGWAEIPDQAAGDALESLPAPTQTQANEAIHFEEPAPPAHSGPASAEEGPSPADHPHPRVAIIIDDMGYHGKIGAGLLALELNLSFSFLPHAPLTGIQVQEAYDLGRDILVHLPMEPKDPLCNPGKGALYTGTEPAELAVRTEGLLAMVPHATGANNHMGSRFTEVREAMIPVLQSLKKRNFFFVDSFTSSQSTALNEARKMGIPAARRDVFLDNDRSPEKVCLQLEKLVLLATAQGWAVGIGHPNPATLNGLLMCKDKYLTTIDMVGIHQLVQ